MKDTGIVRPVDALGRVVLPTELRDTLEIRPGVSLEIYTDKDTIILKKYEPGCILCGEIRDIIDFKGKSICKKCMNDMKASE